jgi:hypothetical protein
MGDIEFIKKNLKHLIPLSYFKDEEEGGYYIKTKYDLFSLNKDEFIEILELFAKELNEVMYNER